MQFNWLIVDEKGNTDSPLPIVKGETKTLYFWLYTPGGAPYQFSYSTTDITVKFSAATPVVKNYSSGVASYVGNMSFYVLLSAADTSALSGDVDISVTIQDGSTVQIGNITKALTVVAPAV